MPTATGTKRVRSIAISRKIVTGTEAVEFDPAKRPTDIDPNHTHRWKVYVKGVDNADISYFIKKVQFKLHDTYPNTLRTVESPPFELEETGWGEFEIQIKLHFVPEANEKMQTYWHPLKLHHYEGDVETKKARREMVKNEQLEEIVFNEPMEPFYDILTGGHESKGKAGKAGKASRLGARTAEIPLHDTPGNHFSQETEAKEYDRLVEALKMVRELKREEQESLTDLEKKVKELRESEGVPAVKKK